MKTFVAKKTASTYAPIEFELAGDVYHFTGGTASDFLLGLVSADKGAFVMVDRTRESLNWLGAGLGPDHDDHTAGNEVEGCEACRLQKRLMDKKDEEVTLEVVMEVVNWLVGEISARPTGPSSA